VAHRVGGTVGAMIHSGVRGGGGAAVVAGGDGEVLLPEGEKMGEERPKKEGEGWGGGVRSSEFTGRRWQWARF
jgi:hypothetical protein